MLRFYSSFIAAALTASTFSTVSATLAYNTTMTYSYFAGNNAGPSGGGTVNISVTSVGAGIPTANAGGSGSWNLIDTT